jgi:diguanylate cyclase (GGDEF)-like protein
MHHAWGSLAWQLDSLNPAYSYRDMHQPRFVQDPHPGTPLPWAFGMRRTVPLRFAVSALALALTAALGTQALTRALTESLRLPMEVSAVAITLVVAMGSVAIGWIHGARVGKLVEEARRDPVTRVGNRRLWEESLAHEVAAAAGARMPLSLLVLDVDNLKQLNDMGGHHAGDVALAVVGDVLNETCRSRDIAARFGGDEFAVLLPRTRASEARVVAERIRSELARRRASCPPPVGAMLTVSIGICDLTAIDNASPAALFEGADRALYVAKQSGRDRVELAAPPPRTSSVIRLDDARQRKRHPSRSSG